MTRDLEHHRAFQAALRDDRARAVRLLRRIREPALRALDRAQLDHVRGRHRAALDGYRSAATLFRRQRNERGVLAAAVGGVMVAALLGDAAAVRAWRRRQAGATAPHWFSALGSAYDALGDGPAAEECFARVIRSGKGVVKATALQNLGLCLARRGALREAGRALDRAVREFGRLEHEASLEIIEHNRAWLAALTGDTWTALQGYRRARARFEKRGDRRRAALVALDEAELAFRLGDLAGAAPLARQAAQRLRRESPVEAARAQLLLARANGRKASARRARALFRSAGDRAGEAAADVVLGENLARAERILRDGGRWLDALEALVRHGDRKLLEGRIGLYPRSLRRWMRPELLRLMADDIAGLRRAWRAAEEARGLAPTSRLRAASLLLHAPIYEALAAALLDRGRAADLREAFLVVDSARARTLREELERESPGLFDHPAVRRARQRLDSLWREVDRERGLRRASVDRGEREFLAAVAAHESPLPLRAAPQLPPRATLTHVVLGRRVHGLLWDGARVRSWDCGPLRRLRTCADALRLQVTRRLFGAASNSPAEACLEELGCRLLDEGPWPEDIAVRPLADLGAVPFEALPPLREATVTYTPAAGWNSPRWKPGSALAVGIDTELPHVAEETGLVPRARRLVNPDPAATVAALPGRRLVHFAGHAVAHEAAPPLSALRLRDGWLTASDLRPGTLRGALVVLSACRTGDPGLTWRGEGFAGFPRAVLAAGAAAVVASRWDVPDESALAFMRAFYAHLRDDPARAVRAAAQDLRMQGRHPAEWASFLLISGVR